MCPCIVVDVQDLNPFSDKLLKIGFSKKQNIIKVKENMGFISEFCNYSLF
jgi:hypothetical protein